jgi:hypothetical protein
MEGEQIEEIQSKKRQLHMMPEEFLSQFSSKKDLLNYLREQL